MKQIIFEKLKTKKLELVLGFKDIEQCFQFSLENLKWKLKKDFPVSFQK